MAGEWGTKEEFLHPRDQHGRFRKSWKMATSVIDKISDLLTRFNPKTFSSDEEAQNFVKGWASSDRHLTNRGAFMDKFLRGWSQINTDLRTGKETPDSKAMDKAMRPLPNDLILSRTVGPEAFGLDATNMAQMEEYTGKLVSDKGFSSTNIGTPHRRQGAITMVIATPAGTRAVAPHTGPGHNSEIILDRDQPFRITKVSPDGTGGFYVMAVATEKGGVGQTKPKTLGGKAPVPNAEEINQPPAVPGQPPQAPGQVPAAPQAAPVRTGKPGRPAGPPPPPRTEQHVAENIGGNGPSQGAPQTPETPQAPTTPETPVAPEAGAPELPPTPEDPRVAFREEFKKADVPVPAQGPRRATYNRAYLALANRKTNPDEVARGLDHEIALNEKTIESDRLDGTDSGPLPEDNERLKKLSQFIKDHFQLQGGKKREEGKPEPAKKAAPKAPAAAKKAAAPTTSEARRHNASQIEKGLQKENAASAGKVNNSDLEGKDVAQLRAIADKEGIPTKGAGSSPEEVAQTIRDIRFKRTQPASGFGNLPAKKAAPSVPAKKAATPAVKRDDLDGKSVEELRAIADKEGIPTRGAGDTPEEIAQTIRDVRFKKTQPAAGFGKGLGETRARAPRTPEGFEAPTPEQKAQSDAIRAARAERQKAAGVLPEPPKRPKPTPEEAAAKKVRKAESDAAVRDNNARIRKEMRTERVARGDKPAEPTQEQRQAAEVARAAGDARAAEAKITNEKLDAEAANITNGWLADAGVSESDLSDFEKVGLRLVGGQVAQGKISRAEARRRLAGPNSPDNLKKVAASISSRPVKKAAPPAPVKKAAPAKAAPSIPAKDLSDKGLLQRFEAEIKQDNPDEKRLKELGDELERRDLASATRIKGLSDENLLKQFQDEIGKDNLNQEKVDKLGAELDRRDALEAKNQQKIDALLAKGRSYQDAYAEVHGLDPEKLDLQSRQASVDAQRRPGESREATLRRLYEDDLRRQYVDAENATRGHLLTPEGRSQGVDPKSLFQGNTVRSNKWASDELKEYWQSNPRKTYTQFKADTLGQRKDIEAAKKTQGVQKDLDLGHIIKRAPVKKIAVPSDLETKYRTTTIAQLRQQAKDGNIEVPKSLRLKQDIFDHVTKELAKREQGRRSAEAPKTPAAVKKAAPAVPAPVKAIPPAPTPAPAKAAPEAPKSGAPDIDKMTVAQLRQTAKDEKVPATAGMTKDRLKDAITRNRDLPSVINTEGIKQIAEDSAAKAAPKPVKAPNLPGTSERYQKIGRDLKSAQSREEAQQILSDAKMTVPQLKELADSLNIAVRGNKDQILKDLVHWTTGRRLDSAAVSKPGATTSRALNRAAEVVPGKPKVSPKPVLPNHWGTLGGPVNYHMDGHIGRAVVGMGNDNQSLEVPGEDDNVANVLGKLATRAVHGDLTQEQLMAEVRKVRDKMSDVPAVRNHLDRALKDMDVPDVKLPNLPEGTPSRISELMKDLSKVPLAREDRRGMGSGTSTLDRLAEIMDEWSKGRLTPLALISKMQSALYGNHHESEEGKFEIDRIVKDALADLNKMLKVDRKSLYPPITRS